MTRTANQMTLYTTPAFHNFFRHHFLCAALARDLILSCLQPTAEYLRTAKPTGHKRRGKFRLKSPTCEKSISVVVITFPLQSLDRGPAWAEKVASSILVSTITLIFAFLYHPAVLLWQN